MLLVADEVICGFGRTGRWFGSERFGIEPDIMTLAKGLSSGYVPIAAVLLGPRVGDALAGAGEEWAHGFTYWATRWPRRSRSRTCASSRPRACTSAQAGRLGTTSRTHWPALPTTPGRGGAQLRSARRARAGRGQRGSPLIPARAQGRPDCREHCIANGLVMRAVRDVMILAPPLIITEAEIDQIALCARRALDLTRRDLAID